MFDSITPLLNGLISNTQKRRGTHSIRAGLGWLIGRRAGSHRAGGTGLGGYTGM